jgi:hypothetical protein
VARACQIGPWLTSGGAWFVVSSASLTSMANLPAMQVNQQLQQAQAQTTQILQQLQGLSLRSFNIAAKAASALARAGDRLVPPTASSRPASPPPRATSAA